MFWSLFLKLLQSGLEKTVTRYLLYFFSFFNIIPPQRYKLLTIFNSNIWAKRRSGKTADLPAVKDSGCSLTCTEQWREEGQGLHSYQLHSAQEWSRCLNWCAALDQILLFICWLHYINKIILHSPHDTIHKQKTKPQKYLKYT